jgi:hypothetical protein
VVIFSSNLMEIGWICWYVHNETERICDHCFMKWSTEEVKTGLFLTDCWVIMLHISLQFHHFIALELYLRLHMNYSIILLNVVIMRLYVWFIFIRSWVWKAYRPGIVFQHTLVDGFSKSKFMFVGFNSVFRLVTAFQW